jgi:hypothetical protein
MCEHKDFHVHAAINRLEDIGRFAADITIRCTECNLPFQFLGLPGGLHLDSPTCSVDATEARLPIVPYGESLMAFSGVRGFTISEGPLSMDNS